MSEIGIVGLTKSEHDEVTIKVHDIGVGLDKAAKSKVATMETFRDAYERKPQTWIPPVQDRLRTIPSMSGHLETVRDVEETIKANPPAAEPTLSSSAKSTAIRSLEYAEKNVVYTRGSVRAVPSMLEKTTRLSADLASLKTAVIDDPPIERHSRTHRNVRHGVSVRVGSRRGLTPRQRRRL